MDTVIPNELRWRLINDLNDIWCSLEHLKENVADYDDELTIKLYAVQKEVIDLKALDRCIPDELK